MRHLRLLLLSLVLSLTAATAAAEPVDINTADRDQLMQLDGVGVAKADAIIEYREQNGPFESVEQLTEVKGIGAATLEANRENLSTGKR